MPSVKRKLTFSARKSAKKSKSLVSARGLSTTVNTALGGIPQRIRTRLIYSDAVRLTAAAGTQNYLFRLNSLFDPDLTGTGHQPQFFDQYATLYNNYRVWNCRWIINARSATTGTPVNIMVSPENGSTTWGADMFLGEHPQAQQRLLESANTGVTFMSGSVSLPALNGVTAAEYKDDKYMAAVTTNPSDLNILHIHTYSPIDLAHEVDVTIKLIYDVEFFDYKQVAQS